MAHKICISHFGYAAIVSGLILGNSMRRRITPWLWIVEAPGHV